MTPELADLQREYEALHAEATRLAGGLTDLAQRAAVYHHLFEDSGRNHVFPLIAAHGALWARGYFAFGNRLARGLAWQYGLQPEKRREQLAALATFEDALRDINRRVCIDTYASFYFTARHGAHPDASAIVRPGILAALNYLHGERRRGRELSDADKRAVFEAHFLNEQQTVVGPSIEAAVAAFAWPVVKTIALRPVIRFAYFPGRRVLWFRRFDDRDERIRHGLSAFDLGATVGWRNVEQALAVYEVLPAAFFAGSRQHFDRLRAGALAQA